ncbi:hypothetical protein ALI144C_24415 [Actinosynnema sp. ALI-1.44]|uniref:hypothetical protein n=1 Tax=Actinosynnema sp. ALI-1.44 TaxID=1933779 RepID=UPI00097CBC71|nr:hypothetical protein [Actinosynnema sp. ALI-1.44]ONI79878.1 hypothetical protein ALI144C_24415 [Actinosynnema sp. ALI-1.44]
MARSEIRFDYLRRGDSGVPQVVPRVDGAPLTDLIDRFEIGAGMRPAGNVYGGLASWVFRSAPVEDYFHGLPADATGPRTALLACSCGDVGCWPLLARVTTTDEVVIWDDFQQPHRRARDYTAFGPFQFDRDRYDVAVRELSAAIDADKT